MCLLSVIDTIELTFQLWFHSFDTTIVVAVICISTNNKNDVFAAIGRKFVVMLTTVDVKPKKICIGEKLQHSRASGGLLVQRDDWHGFVCSGCFGRSDQAIV